MGLVDRIVDGVSRLCNFELDRFVGFDVSEFDVGIRRRIEKLARDFDCVSTRYGYGRGNDGKIISLLVYYNCVLIGNIYPDRRVVFNDKLMVELDEKNRNMLYEFERRVKELYE